MHYPRPLSLLLGLALCTAPALAQTPAAPAKPATPATPAVALPQVGQPIKPATPATPAVAPTPPDPNTVAIVNGQKITRNQLVDAVMQATGPAMLDRMIQQMILEQAAKKQGITVTDADIDRAEAAYKSTAPTPQIWNDYVKRVGEQRIRNEVLRPQVIQAKLGERLVTITPGDLDEVQASHILIRTQGADDAAAKAKAEHVLALAKAPGADFAALAKQYSDDPGSAQKGGDLGYFTRDRMVKPFADAAFAAKVGDIVGPVKSAFGYHIIKVTGRKPASALPPAELERQKMQLIQQRSSEAINLWLQRQRAQAKVEKFLPGAQ